MRIYIAKTIIRQNLMMIAARQHCCISAINGVQLHIQGKGSAHAPAQCIHKAGSLAIDAVSCLHFAWTSLANCCEFRGLCNGADGMHVKMHVRMWRMVNSAW